MKPVLTLLDRALCWALIGLMTAMVLSVAWQVVSRYVLSAPSSWTEELARYLLIWIGMLGAAWAFRSRMHIGLDLLPKRLTGRSARNLHIFTLGVIALFALTALVIGGGQLMLLTWQLRQTSAALGLPIAFVYSVIPLTGALVVLYSLAAMGDPPGPDVAGEAD